MVQTIKFNIADLETQETDEFEQTKYDVLIEDFVSTLFEDGQIPTSFNHMNTETHLICVIHYSQMSPEDVKKYNDFKEEIRLSEKSGIIIANSLPEGIKDLEV